MARAARGRDACATRRACTTRRRRSSPDADPGVDPRASRSSLRPRRTRRWEPLRLRVGARRPAGPRRRLRPDRPRRRAPVRRLRGDASPRSPRGPARATSSCRRCTASRAARAAAAARRRRRHRAADGRDPRPRRRRDCSAACRTARCSSTSPAGRSSTPTPSSPSARRAACRRRSTSPTPSRCPRTTRSGRRPGVLVTPHVGGATEAMRPRAMALVRRQVIALRDGQPLRNVVATGEAAECNRRVAARTLVVAPADSGHCEHDRDHRRHRHAQGAVDRPQHRPAGVDPRGSALPHERGRVRRASTPARAARTVLAGVKSWHWGPTVQASDRRRPHVDRERRARRRLPDRHRHRARAGLAADARPQRHRRGLGRRRAARALPQHRPGRALRARPRAVGPPAPADLGARASAAEPCTRSSPSPAAPRRCSSR